MLALLLYVSVASPMEIFFSAFPKNTAISVVNILIDILFIADIVLNFRTGYIDEAKKLVLDKTRIRSRYLRGWFILDVVSSFPVQVLILINPLLQDLLGLKLVRLLKLGRLSRVNRIKILRDMQYNGAIRPGVVRFVKLMSMYLYIVHITACIYWYLADPALHDDPACASGTPLIWGVCDELSFGEQYTHALYWTSVVFMGNDSFPGTQTRKLFSLGVLLIGMMVNAVVIGSCASLLANLDSQAVMKQQLFDSINEHLAYHKVSKDLGRRVRSYYEYLWACGHSTKDDLLFRELPDKMKMELMMTKKRPLLAAVDMFRNLSAECIVAVVYALQPTVMLPQEYVVVQNQEGHEMFFINRGLVQVSRFINFVETGIRQLGDGGHFGEIALLAPDRRRTANVCTLTFCDLQILKRRQFEALQRQFSDFRRTVKRLSDERRASETMMRKLVQAQRFPKRKSDASPSRSTTLLKGAQKTMKKLRSTSRPRRSVKTAPEPACMWTAEAAEEQVVRKSADEVFKAATSLAALSAGARRMASGGPASFSRAPGKSRSADKSARSPAIGSVRSDGSTSGMRVETYDSQRDESPMGGRRRSP
jgi:potassium voltage-gated channel Eag-related subfamily H protein 7